MSLGDFINFFFFWVVVGGSVEIQGVSIYSIEKSKIFRTKKKN